MRVLVSIGGDGQLVHDGIDLSVGKGDVPLLPAGWRNHYPRFRRRKIR